MSGDDYYDLSEQLAELRRQLFDLADQVDRLSADLRLVRYDLDTLDRHLP
jgi:hypothetical protein